MLAKWFYEFWILVGHNDSHLCSQLTNLIKEVGMQHVGTVFVA